MTAGTVWGLSQAKTAVTSPPVAVATIAETAVYNDQRQTVAEAVHWLIPTHQNDDGGYSSFSSGANQAASSIAGTADALLAISAGGYNSAVNYPGESSNPIMFLQNNAADAASFAASGGGSAGKLILALTAASQNPRDFMGYNLVLSLTNQISPTGQYNVTSAFDQSLALLALAAVQETVPANAIQWLKDQQAANGSWDDGYGTIDNPDATSIAIMALVANGESVGGTTLTDAKNFLAAAQLADGGFEYGTGFGSNPNSTALAVQALSALGEDFYTTGGDWDQNGNTPLSALQAYQSSTGAFQSDYGSGPFDDFFATVQSIPAATGKPFPLPARYEAARQAVSCLATLQDAETGGWEQFAGFGVNAAGTSRAIEAIAAYGDDPQSMTWTPTMTNAVAGLEYLTPSYLAAGRGGRVGIVMQGVVAAGAPYDVSNFAGYNLPISVTGYLSPTGEYASTAFGPQAHNEAMLGLLAAGEMVDGTAVTWLQNAQTNGSWGGGDSNGTSLNALSQLGEEIPFGVLANLHATQQTDGGWGFGVPASVNSTAEVVLGLVEYGDNPFAPAWSVVLDGKLQNPADVVLAQQGDNGCWPNPFGPGDDPYSTTDAILLLMANPEWAENVSYLEYNLYAPILSNQ